MTLITQQQKHAKDLNMYFFFWKHPNGQDTHAELVNINHKENEPKGRIRYTPHLLGYFDDLNENRAHRLIEWHY